MEKHKLNVILQKHQAWLNNTEGGERADLRGADLSGADLRGANLRDADLRYAKLSGANLYDADLSGTNLYDADLSWADLRGADLSGADLRDADLYVANLRGANLRGADLRYANLRGANLRDADLRGADLDFASWPLYCGSLSPGKCDRRLTAQLVRHTLAVALAEGDVYGAAVIEALAPLDCFHEFRTDIKPFNKGE